jgi:hypothetical protein
MIYIVVEQTKNMSDNGTNGREVRYEERIKKMEQRREVRE